MGLYENIIKLSELRGPSGCEKAAADAALELLKELTDEAWTDKYGNVVGVRRCGRENAPKLLFDAHLDEIGFIITGEKDGFLTFKNIGGVDSRMLPDSEVVILTEPPKFGVMTCMPPHLLTAAEMNKAIPGDDIYIDAGGESVPVGTFAVFKSRAERLGENLICGKAFDDRACFAVLIRALELLQDESMGVDLYVMGSRFEEVGAWGAETGTYVIAPDFCVAVDVTHGVTPDGPKAKTFALNAGPAIGVGPNMTRSMTEGLISAAKENEIPYQTEVMSGNSGTNGWVMQISREGVPTGVLSVPLKYMHTPVETIDIRDAENAAKLLAEFAKRLGGAKND